MIEEISIRGLGVIGEARLPLGPGFTALTGETGAGKTMVVTGLGLLLGARADAGAVRAGAASAVVEGLLRIDVDGPVAARAREAGGELDDDTLIVVRTVTAEGRSRAHLGGRSVPVGLLGELAPDLVAVHGQADQIRLQSPTRQRELLDRYAGAAVAAPLASYVDCFERLREVQADLEEVRTRGRERAQEADLLRHGLEEVEAVDPQPGEDVALAAELSRLTHADTLSEAADQAHRALTGDTDSGPESSNAVGLIGAAAHAVEPGAALDPALAEIQTRVADLGYLAADLGADLASYAAGVEADPVRMGAAQERVALLRGLTRRYGEDVDAVLAWAQDAAKRLADLDDDGSRLQRLAEERDRLRGRLAETAGQLTAARTEAAQRLSRLVGVELTELAMPHARLDVEVGVRELADSLAAKDTAKGTAKDAGLVLGDGRQVAFGRHGVDEVELLLSPHEGAPARPLSKGASGGELSRVMLALEVVLAGTDPVPTFVFDEVDAGVGGRAAVEIGRRLARLAEQAQVLVVTHLPQVAAYADRHLVVTKSEDGSVTESGVHHLDEAGRVQELARMLAGQEESRSARAHAKELLAAARARD
jgi:DNA repair protein RecN (Recombination protein N)